MKLKYASVAALAALSVLLSSCVYDYGHGYGTFSYSTNGYSSSVAWTSASYDANGFPIFGYSYGRPVYGYTEAGVAIFTVAALTALCFVPHWNPAPWYHGHWHYPAHIHRCAAPPHFPQGHRPGHRPPGGLNAPIHKNPGSVFRPQGANRPGMGNQPGNRPGIGNQPGNRPGNNPGMGNNPGNRPGIGNQPGNRPGNNPGMGNNPGNRPSGAKPQMGNSPNNRPQMNQNRPSGNRPNMGGQPGGNRPSMGGQPGGNRPSMGGQTGGARPSMGGSRSQASRPSMGGGGRPGGGGRSGGGHGGGRR